MAEIRWIKIVTDIFDDEKILLIETLPEADSIIVVWFKLLCLAGKQNNSGVFMLNDKLPYTDKMFATIFRRKESTIQLALRTFEDFGMIEIIDRAVTIPNWGKHQNLDQLEERKEYMRNYMRGYREKQKQLVGNANSKANSKANVNPLDKNRVDKNRVEEIREEIIEPVRHKYGQYKNVLLSDEDLQKLQSEFIDYEDRIERLSEYIASTGKSYKSHLATIRSWARKDTDKTKKESWSFADIDLNELEGDKA